MRKLTTNNNAILNRNGIEAYLNDIKELQKKGFTPIHKDEELEIIKKAQNNDQDAKDRLIKSNLSFVVAIAKQYQGRGLEMADLINEGNIGMMAAIEKFDVNSGFKFITYAVTWIRQAIGHATTNKGKMVDMPLNKINDINAIRNAIHKFEQENYYIPSAYELSKILDMDEERIIELQIFANNSTTSFDKPMTSDEESGSLYDIFENSNVEKTDKKVMEDSMTTELERAMKCLSEREKTITKMYFGIGQDFEYSLSQIAEELNLTHERVRQLQKDSLKKLSSVSNNKLLKTYL